MISAVSASRVGWVLFSKMTFTRRMPRSWLAVLGLCLVLAGCASQTDDSFLGLITPYRTEVVQGNVVTKEMAEQLHPGLTRDQVRSLLGAPLLADIFHADRWDYVFTLKRQGAAPQQRRVTVYFSADRVDHFDAVALPSEREFVASIDVRKPDRRKRPLELDAEQIKALPLPDYKALAAPPIPASGPARSYPPLEPLITTR
jgi:outer membrane protein assembly factor BamE